MKDPSEQARKSLDKADKLYRLTSALAYFGIALFTVAVPNLFFELVPGKNWLFAVSSILCTISIVSWCRSWSKLGDAHRVYEQAKTRDVKKQGLFLGLKW